MNLIFKGHTFKYELENLSRMFFPGEKFNIVYDTNPDKTAGDYIAACLVKQDDFTELCAEIFINGNTASLCDSIENTTEEYTKECERILGVLIYKLLSKQTGISPQWGVMTGIRPVKIINAMREKGMTDEEIISHLNTRFLTRKDKIELCIKTADVQKDLLKDEGSKAFSLYISIPFCPSRCVYCSFVSHSIEKFQKLIPEYVAKLQEEIIYTGKLAREYDLQLKTVYFGGGTPTSLCAEDIKKLTDMVAASFDLSHLKEYTFEAGRPDTITEEKLLTIKQAGISRISINPQTLNDDVLKEIGRKHTAQQTIESFYLARNLGFDNINMDVIAGLPSESSESFCNTIDGVVALNPENITVHTLSVKRSSNLLDQAKARYDANAYEIEDMLSYARNRLYDNGYNPYYLYRQKNTLGNFENVGFAKSGYEGVYNIQIMEENQTILALGAGAATKLFNRSTGLISRIFNYKYPYEYINQFDDILSRKQKVKCFYENL